MAKILNYGSSWPAYVQERDDTPPIYRTGSILRWKEGYEQRQKQRDIAKAKSILNKMLDSF